MKLRRFLPLASLILLTSGCASPQKRIQRNQAIFDSFPAEVREAVRVGDIAIGYSRDMVRLAKGDPDYVSVRETHDHNVEVWRWTRRNQVVHTTPVHFVGRGVPSPQFVDMTETREVEILRVEFLNDEAVVIEELRKTP